MHENNSVGYLDDLRFIERTFGNKDTFSTDYNFNFIEVDKVLFSETMTQISYALAVVFSIVLFVTVSLKATVLVVCTVSLVTLQMIMVT